MAGKQQKQNTKAPTARGILQSPAARWGFALLAAVVFGVLLSYFWRVFYSLDGRFPPLQTTLFCIALPVAVVAGAALVRYAAKTWAARGTLCVLLCGLLFVFANPPLQTPDETDHYLRTYAISTGHFDFDAARTYPDDVAALVHAFPGAWVNAHTSAGIGTDPDTGAAKAYNTAGYALKQYGDTGSIESVADSFASYFAREDVTTVSEPVSFLLVPFLPGALGMAAAHLLGLAALGCLYAGRIGNLLAYALLCYLALRGAARCKPVFLCLMLLPMSLFMGGSLSYDATLLGCYYLMLALLTRREWGGKTALLYALACVFVNIAKPYLNLLWIFLPLLVAKQCWHAKGRRWQWVFGSLFGCLGATLLVEWYGTALRYNYPIIARQGGQTVDAMAQLAFVLGNPLRTLAVLWGSLYENEFFIGQLGLFGWKDLPIALLNLTGPCVLLAAALLATPAQNALGRRRTAGLGVFAAVYAAGAMAAMYITYTPVGMVRIVGLQTRYFLAVYLVVVLLAAALLRKALQPQLGAQKAEKMALPLFGGYAVFGALLLFQHYFIGPYYTIQL